MATATALQRATAAAERHTSVNRDSVGGYEPSPHVNQLYWTREDVYIDTDEEEVDVTTQSDRDFIVEDILYDESDPTYVETAMETDERLGIKIQTASFLLDVWKPS